MPQIINIVLFGIGNTGSALINKIVKSSKAPVANEPQFRFPVITNSTVAFFAQDGVDYAWEANFIEFAVPFKLSDVLDYVVYNNLQNLIVVDATPSKALPAEYPDFIKSGFSIVSINETLPFLPDSFEKGIKFLADSRGLTHRFIASVPGDATAAADALYNAVAQVAQHQKTTAY